jgi:hypothetical protein
MKNLLQSKLIVSFLLFFLLINLSFAENFRTNDLPLRGEATYTYWGFTVYHAKVFVPSEVKDVQANLGKTPLRLELTYKRDLKREDFIESGGAFMKDNEEIPYQKVSVQNEQMNALYQNVKEGDTYAIEFIPEIGTTLYYNGEKKGVVTGSDFAASFLGIWLSRYSLKRSFTNEILGINDN